MIGLPFGGKDYKKSAAQNASERGKYGGYGRKRLTAVKKAVD